MTVSNSSCQNTSHLDANSVSMELEISRPILTIRRVRIYLSALLVFLCFARFAPRILECELMFEIYCKWEFLNKFFLIKHYEG